MKDGIHPTYHTKTKLQCSCGNEVQVGSTREEMQVEVCAACHPFYTGKQKLVDAAGRIDKFKKRLREAEKAEKVDLAIKKKQAKRSKTSDIEPLEEQDKEIKLG